MPLKMRPVSSLQITYLEHFVLPTCNYPPTWATTPDMVGNRKNNRTESFHSHFNAQFYARHLNIFMFLEVIKQIQCVIYRTSNLDRLRLKVLLEGAKCRVPD